MKIPSEIKNWLNDRKISDEILERAELTVGATGNIVIPIKNKEGKTLFNKYRRNPFRFNEEEPKYSYEKGASATLYGVHLLNDDPEVIICEGELDVLTLSSQGFNAVCSTGGAGTFKEEWFNMLDGRDLFICFDNDEAGRSGVIRVAKMREGIKFIPLPDAVGEHGDVTDYFVKVGDAEKFKKLMALAIPVFPEKEEKKNPSKKMEKVTEVKDVPIGHFIKINNKGFALCPFHSEKTPSFKVFKDNKYHCFGCGANGDVIDLYMHQNNTTFNQAVDDLKKYTI